MRRMYLYSLWFGIVGMIVMVAGAAFAVVSPANAMPGLISGVVTDPTGNLPPAGTHVHLVSPGGQSFGNAAVDPGTGEFSLGPVANGNYILQAEPPIASGYTPSLPVSLLLTGGPVDAGTLTLTEPTIIGTVFAPDGTTPTTAVLHVTHAHHPIQQTVAISGSIQLGGLFTGTYTLRAEPIGEQPYWWSSLQPITVTPGITQTVNLTLQPANVVGVITDPNGVPVPGATVHVAGITNHAHQADTSGGTGYFAIGDLPDDTYWLIAEPPWNAPGLGASERITFTVPPAFTDLGQIQLRAAPKIVEGVVETNTGIPVENALIIANRLDHPGRQETLTITDGSYLLHLTGGLWSLTVEHTPSTNPPHWLYNHAPQLVHFDHDLEPEAKTVNFEVLTADSHITGTIEMPDSSTPPFTVTVNLRTNEGYGRSVLMDAGDGSFDVQLPHGNYVLHVNPHDPGYAGPSPQQVYAPISDTLEVGILTLLPRDATISGAVVDEDGNGVGGIHLIGWTREHLGAHTRTSPDGSYALAVTAGEWLVKPEVPADMPYIYTGLPISSTLVSGQVISNINFALTAANNQVVGQLVDGHGNPVLIEGWAAAGNENGRVNGAPIHGGSFTIYLPDGSYQVGIHLPPNSRWLAGEPQPVTVSGGETVTITVPLHLQNAHIVGALWDPRNEVTVTDVEAQVTAENPWTSVSDAINTDNGTYHLGVYGGLWHLTYGVDPDSGYVVLDHHKVIPIEAGQTLGVSLPVAERDGLISGTVIGPDGAPLVGAVVVADGIGGRIGQVVLRTFTDATGEFDLPVPFGVYRLSAGEGRTDWLNPVIQTVIVPPGGTISGLVLQFRESDVVVSGVTSIDGNPPINGRVHIWAYSDDGAATHTSSLLGESYELNVLSNETWHIGATLETPTSYYTMRTSIALTTTNQVLDLVLTGPHPKPGPVVVTFDSSQPQTLALADGTQIYIPAGAMPVSGTVTLHITPIATLPHQHHARLYKYGYAFVATDETGAPITSNFTQNVMIRFSYTDAELYALGLSESHLHPAYFSTSTATWTVPDSYVVNTRANQVTMQIDHFTDFSLMSRAVFEVYLPVAVK